MRDLAAKRLEELLPAGALQQLVALIEENKRRVAQGKRSRERQVIELEYEPSTGDVEEVVLPRGYRRER